MKNNLWVTGVALLMSMALSNAALAKKAQKEDICHFDKDTGLFKAISVSGNAIATHFSQHGDVLPGDYYADTDGDGFGAGDPVDTCPNPGTADNGDDVFPNDSNENADSDGDGVGDNSDNCPNEYGEDENGCPVVVAEGSDILVGNNLYWSHSNGVTRLDNDGFGNFPSGQNFNTRLAVTALRVADFNEDGNHDVVVGHNEGLEVWVGLGDGNGNFAMSGTGIIAGAASKIATADVNNDGDLDFVIAQNSGYITVGLGDGMGGFTGLSPIVSGGATRSIAVGDVNGDGNLDYANIAHAGHHSVNLSYGDGSGGISNLVTLFYGGVDLGVAMGDVDGDGDIDIVSGGQGQHGLKVYENTGNDASNQVVWSRTKITSPNQMNVHTLQDMDGDGDLDVVSTGYIAHPSHNAWTVEVHFNDGNGNFDLSSSASIPTSGGEMHDVAIGDVTGDGAIDMVTNSYPMGAIVVVPGDGTPGGFGIPYMVSSPLMTRTVGVDLLD